MRERGVLVSDRARSCKPNFEQHVDVNGLAYHHISLESRASHGDRNQCVFQFLGRDVNTASFAMYVFSFSVFVS